MFVVRLQAAVLLATVCNVLVECRAAHAPLITPAPDVNDARLARRQLGTSTLADTCGYQDANVCNTNSASPYCYTNFWPTLGQTLLEIGCTTAQGQFFYAYSTYTGFGAEISDLVTATSSPVATLPVGGTSALPSETAAGTNNADTAGTSGSSANEASPTEGGSQPSSSSDNSGGSSSNTGAIAGGVVGGVAVLGLIAALITWIILRNRRKERAAATASSGGYGAAQSSAGDNEGKPPMASITPVSPISPSPSHVPARKPVGHELQGGGPRHEVPGYAEAQELHPQQRVPELP
ncbi:hypothetical protein Slin14017_G046810 [Septoria linicola]|nr:hypothetical protein Slin14017_G046810 [Septoria linicola]